MSELPQEPTPTLPELTVQLDEQLTKQLTEEPQSVGLTPGLITALVFVTVALILYIAGFIHCVVTCIINWNSKDLEIHNRSALFLILFLAFPAIFPFFYWFLILYYRPKNKK